jgi:isoleucyl-tRNA synthetase
MSSLPPALNFVKAEEEVCQKWSEENTFKTQNRLSEERGDEVCYMFSFIPGIGSYAL